MQYLAFETALAALVASLEPGAYLSASYASFGHPCPEVRTGGPRVLPLSASLILHLFGRRAIRSLSSRLCCIGAFSLKKIY